MTRTTTMLFLTLAVVLLLGCCHRACPSADAPATTSAPAKN